jgi:hypothetical protein
MKTVRARLMVSLLCVPLLSIVARVHADLAAAEPIRHVLLISVDGMHAVDLANYVQMHPNSTLARLSGAGVTYPNASASRPSDSFPGLLAMITGGSPAATGVFYDVSYDRALSAPGSNCARAGTEVAYDESVDKNPDALDGGGGIDPTKLPGDARKACAPVYPHEYLRVNTLFEVIKAAGGRTAWSDKHPAYDLVNGPSGHGVDDLFTPEINANGTTKSVAKTEAYDDLKVLAILNEIDGKDHTGAQQTGVPTLFGMNFQAVSVAQKLAGGGYTDAKGTPSAMLTDALDHTDASLGKMMDELQKNNLLASTVVIVSAKHGQSPIDPTKKQIVDETLIPGVVEAVQAGLLGRATEDSAALLWLTDSSKTADVVTALKASQDRLGIQTILAGDSLKPFFNTPAGDSRTPDIVVLPRPGVIYTGATATKIAEHGGFSDDDVHVLLVVSNPQLVPGANTAAVQTTQIAPTILTMLGIDPQMLQAVQLEKTPALPGIQLRP